MSTLGHYIEGEGVPTVAISLVREHTEKIRPPRALWVPFEFGRPFGVPHDAAFQKRVLCAAMDLFNAGAGPILADFPDEAPGTSEGPQSLICPVNFPGPIKELNDTELLDQTLQTEIAELRSWYDFSIHKRGRTTAAVSGLSPEAVGEFIASFLHADYPKAPREDIALLSLLRLAIEDIKAYYFEAMTAQPGQTGATSISLGQWFWGETAAAKVLFLLQRRWKDSADPVLLEFSRLLLIPRAFQNLLPYGK